MAGNKKGLEYSVKQPLSTWWAYIKKNFSRYYVQLLKISVLGAFSAMTVLLVFVLVSAGVFFFLGAGMPDIITSANMIYLTAGLLVVLFSLMLMVRWIEESISLTAVVFTDNEFRKRPFGIIETFWKIKTDVLKYLLADFAVRAVLFLPFLLVVAFLGFAVFGGSISPGIASGIVLVMLTIMLFLIYYILITFVYGFFVQFWTYGFLVEKKGVVESLKRSVSLARKNIVKTFAFDVVWIILGMIISIPLTLYGFFARLLIRIIGMAAGISIAVLAVYLIVICIHFVIVLLLSTAVRTFKLPTHYLFWKKIKNQE